MISEANHKNTTPGTRNASQLRSEWVVKRGGGLQDWHTCPGMDSRWETVKGAKCGGGG